MVKKKDKNKYKQESLCKIYIIKDIPQKNEDLRGKENNIISNNFLQEKLEGKQAKQANRQTFIIVVTN